MVRKRPPKIGQLNKHLRNSAHSNLSLIIVKAILHSFLINGQNGGSEVLGRVT